MQFVGRTNFSLYLPQNPALRASGEEFVSEDEYLKYLYDSDRLHSRMQVLTELSLPQIEFARKGHHVTHAISFSRSLPDEFKEELRAAATKHDFLRLDEVEDGHTPTPIERLGITITPGVFVQYRLDDDDLLPKDYFDRIARFAHPNNVGFHVTLGRGISTIKRDSDLFYAREVEWPKIAIGFADICELREDGEVRRPARHQGHIVADRTSPVIVDSSGLGWVWTRHIHQDSILRGAVPTPELAIRRLRAQLSEWPAADISAVENAFPVLAGRIHAQSAPAHATSLPDGPHLLVGRTPLRISFDSPQRRFAVTAISKLENPRAKPLALGFDLRGLDDTRDDTIAALSAQGIYRSARSDIGFYKYLSSREGVNSDELQFTLPMGLTCTGLRLQQISAHDACRITVLELSVWTPSPSDS